MERMNTLIINRLGEHQRKVDFIKSNISLVRNKKHPAVKIRYTFMSMAAAVMILLVIAPMLFRDSSLSDISLTVPSFAEYRGGGFNDIESLIERCQYEDAISIIDQELVKIDIEMENLSSTEMNEEERNYTLAVYNSEKEELMWSKIYILVKLEAIDDLKQTCQSYLNNSDFKQHATDVNEILRKIQ